MQKFHQENLITISFSNETRDNFTATNCKRKIYKVQLIINPKFNPQKFQAINFYEAAMNTSKQPLLRLRFAEQLLRLQNYEKCERVLRDVIDEAKEPSGKLH
jgi:hypothetical protein